MKNNLTQYYPPDEALVSDLRRPSLKTLEMIWPAYNAMARLQIIPEWKVSDIEGAFKLMFPPPQECEVANWDELENSYNAERIYTECLPEDKKESALWAMRGLICESLPERSSE